MRDFDWLMLIAGLLVTACAAPINPPARQTVSTPVPTVARRQRRSAHDAANGDQHDRAVSYRAATTDSDAAGTDQRRIHTGAGAGYRGRPGAAGLRHSRG